MHLRRTEENVEEIAGLVRRYGDPVGVPGVLRALDRQAVRTRVPGLLVKWGFRWDDHDVASGRWWPQGITNSAHVPGVDRRLLVVSWYSQEIAGTNHGSLHGPGYSGGNPLTGTYTLPNGQSLADGFHTYAVDWSPNVVSFSVDGNDQPGMVEVWPRKDLIFQQQRRQRLDTPMQWRLAAPHFGNARRVAIAEVAIANHGASFSEVKWFMAAAILKMRPQ